MHLPATAISNPSYANSFPFVCRSLGFLGRRLYKLCGITMACALVSNLYSTSNPDLSIDAVQAFCLSCFPHVSTLYCLISSCVWQFVVFCPFWTEPMKKLSVLSSLEWLLLGAFISSTFFERQTFAK